MKQAQLTCGIWQLIEHGIQQHEKEHGRRPVALILHPAHKDEFCLGSESNAAVLGGISVGVAPLFDMPVLVDENGDHHYL
ncbi:hypothetical protein [Paraburkholderia unamae]|uniref:Uncharacterized protein n=1 Tax=Paraburkholderia unamae TaxID=219649 RepID=A0ABX5KQ33_9BURK|nr:hypothetical protein [Paraburkholderia unamae]PVX82662.1 hypothetical protein C7402_10835 [Paraburkholderia unamae]CAG9267576.1 conserved hypothetical protein [Paraburkholderia unamae]